MTGVQVTDDNGDEIPGSLNSAAGVWTPNDPADTVGKKVTVLIGGNMQLEDVEAVFTTLSPISPASSFTSRPVDCCISSANLTACG